MISFGVRFDFGPWFRFWFGRGHIVSGYSHCMAFLSFILIWRVLGSFIFFSALLSGLHRVCDFFNFTFFYAVGAILLLGFRGLVYE